jgi:hypothetical protein
MFQLTPSFSKAVQCVVFTTVLLSHLTPHRLIQLSVLPLSLQAEGKCSVNVLATRFFQGEGAISPKATLDYVVPSKADDVSSSLGRGAHSLQWK